jgi:hypothetical protein
VSLFYFRNDFSILLGDFSKLKLFGIAWRTLCFFFFGKSLVFNFHLTRLTKNLLTLWALLLNQWNFLTGLASMKIFKILQLCVILVFVWFEVLLLVIP